MLESCDNRTGGVGFVLHIFSTTAETVSDDFARLQLKFATKARFLQFSVEFRKGGLRRLPACPSRLRLSCSSRWLMPSIWRQQWATSHSSRNSATRSRRTPPRQGAQPWQNPNKTATTVLCSPRRRERSSSPGRTPPEA